MNEKEIINQIHNMTGCPYWSIIACLKLCNYDYRTTIKMLKEIYFVIGDNPDSVVKRREEELKERIKEEC